MQLQKLFALSTLALLGNVVGTLADLEADEVPKECKQVCDSVVQRSNQCDNETHDDRAEKECMCKLKDASSVIPRCEACVAKYHSEVSDHSDPHDNDVYDIIQFCQFTTTTYNGGGTPATSSGSMPSATGSSATGSSATGSSATGSSTTGSSATSSGVGGGVGAIPSSPTAAPSGPGASGPGSATGSASSAMPTYTGGATLTNTGQNAIGALGAVFACAAVFM